MLQVVVGAQLRDVLPGDAVRHGGAVLGMRVGMVGMEPVRGIPGETERTARPRPRPRARPRRPEPRPRRDVPSGDARREPREPVSPERHLPRLARQRVRMPPRARVQVRARLARLLGAFLLGHQGRDRRSRARRSRARLPRAFSFRLFFFSPPRRRRFRRRRGGAARFATRLLARAGRARGFGLATLRNYGDTLQLPERALDVPQPRRDAALAQRGGDTRADSRLVPPQRRLGEHAAAGAARREADAERRGEPERLVRVHGRGRVGGSDAPFQRRGSLVERREVLRAARRRRGERRAQRLPASRRARRVSASRLLVAFAPLGLIFRLLHAPRVIGVLEHRGDALGERVHGAHAQDLRQAPHGSVDLSTELVQAEPRRRRVGLVRRVRLGDAPRVILTTLRRCRVSG